MSVLNTGSHHGGPHCPTQAAAVQLLTSEAVRTDVEVTRGLEACFGCLLHVISERKEAAAVWTDPFRSMAFQNICSEG